MLKRYCTTPCTFYVYESNYKFCKACDGSDKELLDEWFCKNNEKEIKYTFHREVIPPAKSSIEGMVKQMLNNVYGARANAKYVSHKDRNDYVDAIAYCQNDIDMVNRLHKKLSEMEENDMNYTAFYKMGGRTTPGYLAIEKVHFSGPVTAVIWNDHTKTVVRCQDGEDFDPEKGLAMAIAKKMFGNKGSYFDVFKEWIPEEERDKVVGTEPFDITEVAEGIEKASATARKAMNAFSGDCKTCKHEKVLGYKWPCVKCRAGSKWRAKGE